jgi:hypothetical protein
MDPFWASKLNTLKYPDHLMLSKSHFFHPIGVWLWNLVPLHIVFHHALGLESFTLDEAVCHLQTSLKI